MWPQKLRAVVAAKAEVYWQKGERSGALKRVRHSSCYTKDIEQCIFSQHYPESWISQLRQRLEHDEIRDENLSFQTMLELWPPQNISIF